MSEKNLTTLQYLGSIFGSDGIEKWSHIAIPLVKLQEIWAELSRLDTEQRARELHGAERTFADYLRRLPTDDARKAAIALATGDFCRACGREEVETYCQCENDE